MNMIMKQHVTPADAVVVTMTAKQPPRVCGRCYSFCSAAQKGPLAFLLAPAPATAAATVAQLHHPSYLITMAMVHAGGGGEHSSDTSSSSLLVLQLLLRTKAGRPLVSLTPAPGHTPMLLKLIPVTTFAAAAAGDSCTGIPYCSFQAPVTTPAAAAAAALPSSVHHDTCQSPT